MTEIARRDPNYVTTIMGVDMSTGQLPTAVYVDESTHRLLVSAIITGGSPTGTEYTEGDIDSTFSGFMMLGEAPTNTAMPIQVTADGKLRVDASVTATVDTTGLATDTNQTTIIGHLDGVEGLLTTIDADTGAIAASVASIDTKTPALGQALDTGSVPVVLTAAQLATLTPPAAITGYATSANQTTIIGHVDGIEGLLTTIDSDTSTLITPIATIGTTPLQRVAIFDASNNQITTFGGGTQYTEGDIDASITGTAMLMEVAANTVQPVQGTVADGLLVNLGANNDVTITGSVAVTGTFWQATQPISGTVTINAIPAGTNNIGDVDVLTVPTDPFGANADAASTSGSISAKLRNIAQAVHVGDTPLIAAAVVGAQFDDVAPSTVTENSVRSLRMSSRRELYSQIRDAAGNERGVNVTAGNALVVDGSATTQPVSGTFWQATQPVSIAAAVGVTDNAGSLTVDAPVGTPVFVRLSDGAAAISTLPVSLASVPSHAVTNAGTFAVQVDGSALTALQLIDDTVFADDAAFTVAVSKVSAIGMLADETSTDSVDEGDIGAPRMTLDRKTIVTVEPHTAGGWDTANMTSGDTFTALTNTAQAIKASAGKLGGWYIYNPNSSAAYVILYNVAQGSVTVGTTTPKLVLCIPATSAANLEMVNGITFDTAIAVAATTTGGGNTAPTTALEANFWYK